LSRKDVAPGKSISAHPPKAFFDELRALDRAAQSRVEQAQSVGIAGDVLEQLGIVGRADAAGGGPIVYEPYNQYPTPYLWGYQNYSDEVFSQAVYWYNPPGQGGMHSVRLVNGSSWYGGFNPLIGADPGGRDVLSIQWNPGVMYEYGRGWSPDLPGSSPACRAGMQLNMDASMANDWNGAFTQQPSHCARYSQITVDLRPNSPASYNTYFNAFWDFNHTWNQLPAGISVSAGYGWLSVDAGFLGGQWNKHYGESEYC
jgi:hypothetical protein